MSKKRVNWTTWWKVRLDKLAFSQSKYYQDLSLPLYNFIQCLVKGNLNALVIKGRPRQEDLAEAWAMIYSQYIDANAENDKIYSLELRREITLLRSHVNETETCMLYLRVGFYPDLVRILRNNGYRDKFESQVPEEYERVLVVIESKLAMKKLALAGKEKEYKQYMSDKENDTIDEKYFSVWLLRLAKYQGVGILRAKDITVSEFVLLLKDYLEFVRLHTQELEDAKQGKD